MNDASRVTSCLKFMLKQGLMGKNIGVLAFQGGVQEHMRMIQHLGYRVLAVRSVRDLEKCLALIIPGGESTTIGFFLRETGLDTAIKKRAYDGMPIFGTCAGAILLAKHVQGHHVPPHLGLIDMTIERNAYGRQVDSFYTEIDIPKLKIRALKAAFIRAPVILDIEEKSTTQQRHKTSPEILARHEGKIVLVQQGNLLASTFHPELTHDWRLHQYFVGLVDSHQ